MLCGFFVNATTIYHEWNVIQSRPAVPSVCPLDHGGNRRAFIAHCCAWGQPSINHKRSASAIRVLFWAITVAITWTSSSLYNPIPKDEYSRGDSNISYDRPLLILVITCGIHNTILPKIIPVLPCCCLLFFDQFTSRKISNSAIR